MAYSYSDPIWDLEHNERGKARQQKQPEPAEELDYDVEGIVPHN